MMRTGASLLQLSATFAQMVCLLLKSVGADAFAFVASVRGPGFRSVGGRPVTFCGTPEIWKSPGLKRAVAMEVVTIT